MANPFAPGVISGGIGLKAKSPTDNINPAPQTLAPNMAKAPTAGTGGLNNYSVSSLKVPTAPGPVNQNQPAPLNNPLRVAPGQPNGFNVPTAPKPITPSTSSYGTPVAQAATGTPPASSAFQTNNPYAMTQQEASGGLMGQQLYLKRINGLGGQDASNTGNTANNTPQSTQSSNTPSNGLMGQLISQLQQKASQPSADYTAAQDQAQRYNQQLEQSRANEARALGQNASNPIPLEFQQGRAQVLQNQYSQEQAALGAGYQGATNLLGAANTQQGLQQSGLGTAASLTMPQQVPYSNQYLNPLTGQPIGGGGAGQLPQDAQNAVNSYAQQVQNGSMTRADAESRLSAYGIAGTNALNQALGPNFNTNASNASAGTTATGQQLQANATAANLALDKLQSDFGNLSWWQSKGFPFTNDIAQTLGNQFGASNTSTYTTTLNDARAQLQGILTASGAATPTGAESVAKTYLPDGMTAQQLVAKVAAAKALIQQKVSSFTQSGNQNSSSSSNGSGNIYSF